MQNSTPLPSGVPHVFSIAVPINSQKSVVHAHGHSSSASPMMNGLNSTIAVVRSGYVAAKTTHVAAPSEVPNSAALRDPTASITARMSSVRSSIVGTFKTGSDRPVPRLSNKISRQNDDRC